MTANGTVQHDPPRPFLEHLSEFRRMLLQALLVLGVAVAVAIPLTPHLLQIMKWPLRGIVSDPDTFLVSYEIAAGFMVLLRVAFGFGLLLAAPWILLLVGRFVFPGLTGTERQAIRRYAGLAIIMFFAGVAFAFGVILPLALGVMLRLHQWLGISVERILVTNYTSFVTQLLLGFGLSFELPVILLVMGQLGMVSAAQLRARRRHVLVALLVVSALMTPPDLATQLLMALPLMLLFEGCVWLIARNENKTIRNG